MLKLEKKKNPLLHTKKTPTTKTTTTNLEFSEFLLCFVFNCKGTKALREKFSSPESRISLPKKAGFMPV